MDIKNKRIDFPPNKGNAVIVFNDCDVEVKNFLSNHDEEILIGAYSDVYFEKGTFGNDTNYFGAERIFNLAILDIATSVDVDLKKWEVDGENMILDLVNESGLMSIIQAEISNLPHIRKKIERIVSDGRQERFSANGLLKEITDSISNLDFEKVKELMSQVKELEISMKDSPLAPLLDESKRK